MRKIALALPVAASAVAFANAKASETKPAVKRVEPELTGATGFKLENPPEKKNRRGSQSLYPFDSLAVGEAFGAKNKTAANLSSIISNANRKNMRDVKDENGKPVYETKELKGADGAVTTVPDTTKPRREATKHFYAVDVDGDVKEQIKGTPLEGSTVLVIRDI